jgi:hypothetical protein
MPVADEHIGRLMLQQRGSYVRKRLVSDLIRPPSTKPHATFVFDIGDARVCPRTVSHPDRASLRPPHGPRVLNVAQKKEGGNFYCELIPDDVGQKMYSRSGARPSADQAEWHPQPPGIASTVQPAAKTTLDLLSKP